MHDDKEGGDGMISDGFSYKITVGYGYSYTVGKRLIKLAGPACCMAQYDTSIQKV